MSSLKRAHYGSPIPAFLKAPTEEILEGLARRSEHDFRTDQRAAWFTEVEILKGALQGIDGHVWLEFVIPRIGSRADAVVVTDDCVVVIEFKVGETHFPRADVVQVWDYALDLKYFHRGTHDVPVFPILVATAAAASDYSFRELSPDGVAPPARCNATGLGRLLRQARGSNLLSPVVAERWIESPYQPTPTIIEAARMLYSQHSVDAITRNDAGAEHLARTAQCLARIVTQSMERDEKTLVFVTGVPGAGKTLVGLDLATRRRESGSTHATYLSGNGPLVAVLQAALARDEKRRWKAGLSTVEPLKAKSAIKSFIQNVHHFRDEGLRNSGAPSDRIVIFDEAQRAWDAKQTSRFMKVRKNVHDFHQSEPQFLLSYLNRRSGWAVVVCLVGGGQEINVGEAGISAWIEAVCDSLPDWKVVVSPRIRDAEHSAVQAVERLESKRLTLEPALHLNVSMRSFRAESLSRFVQLVLDGEGQAASELFGALSQSYPIVLTRSLRDARAWIRKSARGSERYGMVASSTALRLKPRAIDVRYKVDPVHYFLGERTDTRSSFYLEDAASQYQVQGLELDWACLAWDADLRRAPAGWTFHSFRGTKWVQVKNAVRRQYLLNAYRVLLTRARQGMVIVVPEGTRRDHTRRREYYDSTYEYLRGIGLEVLPSRTKGKVDHSRMT